jgi:hypothetical protein
MEISKQEWKDVEDFVGYYLVSNDGCVKSLKRNGTISGDRILKQKVRQKDGYMEVHLQNPKSDKRRLVHRLMAIAFIPNPENKPQVNHRNGIKTDNRIENLEWATHQENMDHAVKFGLIKKKKHIVISL